MAPRAWKTKPRGGGGLESFDRALERVVGEREGEAQHPRAHADRNQIACGGCPARMHPVDASAALLPAKQGPPWNRRGKSSSAPNLATSPGPSPRLKSLSPPPVSLESGDQEAPAVPAATINLSADLVERRKTKRTGPEQRDLSAAATGGGRAGRRVRVFMPLTRARTDVTMEARLALVVAVALFLVSVPSGGATVVNVNSYGAKGNGVNDDTKVGAFLLPSSVSDLVRSNSVLLTFSDPMPPQALMTAWKAACGAAGAVTMVVPPGTYYIGPVQFHGPCKASTLTFQLQASRLPVVNGHARLTGRTCARGTLKAATDLKRFGNDWIEFGWVNGLTVAGGVIDGQGAASWPFNKCPVRKDCKVLPTSVLFVNNQNTIVRDLTSVNPKFFHIALLSDKNIKISGLKISAPSNSPNTDGIHIERSSGVSITDTHIATGDDCISVGQGNDNVEVARVHVGSLGRYAGEGDVTRVHIRDMTFTGTMNGVRIKTWENSPSKSHAAHMVFENLVMNDVQNPIIIDQKYCPYYNCEHKYVSGVTIQDIQFKNIKGTATTPVAVLLRCGVPCQGLVLQDVNLRYKGQGTASAKCENAKAKYVGVAAGHVRRGAGQRVASSKVR
ncbi:hypothetical protein HU200_047620 [Digitaria exilis]|uniref:Exopolygalacturonase n=1 Tax=Digitaria exilis TaxID=1010633 RepID=A0A835ECQ9_9POAL|nr:hypothetical protein HU200_047620 [Digitaria exilis]